MPKRATSSDFDIEDTKPFTEATNPPATTLSDRSKDKNPKFTPTKSKTKSATTTPTKKSDFTSPSKGIGAFPVEAKKVLLEKAMDLAYKGLPYSELADELGISESRLKDQFKPGRSNLRKIILDLYP
ncbi:hypothetical protein V866_006138 [Kwoniella sp. B9012]